MASTCPLLDSIPKGHRANEAHEKHLDLDTECRSTQVPPDPSRLYSSSSNKRCDTCHANVSQGRVTWGATCSTYHHLARALTFHCSHGANIQIASSSVDHTFRWKASLKLQRADPGINGTICHLERFSRTYYCKGAELQNKIRLQSPHLRRLKRLAHQCWTTSYMHLYATLVTTAGFSTWPCILRMTVDPIVSGLPTVLLMGTPIRRSTRSAERLKDRIGEHTNKNKDWDGTDGLLFKKPKATSWANLYHAPPSCKLWCDAQPAPGQSWVHQNVDGHDIRS